MRQTTTTVSVRVPGDSEDVDGFVNRLREAPLIEVSTASGEYASRRDSGVLRYLTVELSEVSR
ncbi:MAG TPA: hypothetical protein VGG07_11395 [Solirubrobacteraceae bacterium]